MPQTRKISVQLEIFKPGYMENQILVATDSSGPESFIYRYAWNGTSFADEIFKCMF